MLLISRQTASLQSHQLVPATTKSRHAIRLFMTTLWLISLLSLLSFCLSNLQADAYEFSLLDLEDKKLMNINCANIIVPTNLKILVTSAINMLIFSLFTSHSTALLAAIIVGWTKYYVELDLFNFVMNYLVPTILKKLHITIPQEQNITFEKANVTISKIWKAPSWKDQIKMSLLILMSGIILHLAILILTLTTIYVVFTVLKLTIITTIFIIIPVIFVLYISENSILNEIEILERLSSFIHKVQIIVNGAQSKIRKMQYAANATKNRTS